MKAISPNILLYHLQPQTYVCATGQPQQMAWGYDMRNSFYATLALRMGPGLRPGQDTLVLIIWASPD